MLAAGQIYPHALVLSEIGTCVPPVNFIKKRTASGDLPIQDSPARLFQRQASRELLLQRIGSGPAAPGRRMLEGKESSHGQRLVYANLLQLRAETVVRHHQDPGVAA